VFEKEKKILSGANVGEEGRKETVLNNRRNQKEGNHRRKKKGKHVKSGTDSGAGE